MDALQATALLSSALVAAVPLMQAGLGELVTEKSGVLNLGVEGMMLVGAVSGYAVAVHTGQPWLGLLAAGLAGTAMAAVFALLVLNLRANQVATGLALTLFGIGLSAYFGKPYTSATLPHAMPVWQVPLLSDLPVLGKAAFSHNPVVYLSVTLFAAVAWFLYRTRAGLKLRAIGENPQVAHALGFPVLAARWCATLFGGAMAGMAGAYHAVVYLRLWQEQMTSGLGWIALGLVVFATWRPWRLLLGALLFGSVMSLQFYAQTAGVPIPVPFLAMLPYLATVTVLVLISRNPETIRQNAPASLGKTFSVS